MFTCKTVLHLCQLPLYPISVSEIYRGDLCIPALVVWKIVWKDFFKSGGQGGGYLLSRQFFRIKQMPCRWAGRILLPCVCLNLWGGGVAEEGPYRGADAWVALTEEQNCPKLVPGIPPFRTEIAEVSARTVHLYSDPCLGWVSRWVLVFLYSFLESKMD